MNLYCPECNKLVDFNYTIGCDGLTCTECETEWDRAGMREVVEEMQRNLKKWIKVLNWLDAEPSLEDDEVEIPAATN